MLTSQGPPTLPSWHPCACQLPSIARVTPHPRSRSYLRGSEDPVCPQLGNHHGSIPSSVQTSWFPTLLCHVSDFSSPHPSTQHTLINGMIRWPAGCPCPPLSTQPGSCARCQFQPSVFGRPMNHAHQPSSAVLAILLQSSQSSPPVGTESSSQGPLFIPVTVSQEMLSLCWDQPHPHVHDI